jgi:predicted nucleic acid-binding Zn finger protein
MKNPLEDLCDRIIPDEQMRQRIISEYHNRGKKALDIVDQNRVKRYRDFFVVVGESGEYVVEDMFCSCEDYMRRGNLCAHILSVFIARALGRYELIDLWYYEDLKEESIRPI